MFSDRGNSRNNSNMSSGSSNSSSMCSCRSTSATTTPFTLQQQLFLVPILFLAFLCSYQQQPPLALAAPGAGDVSRTKIGGGGRMEAGVLTLLAPADAFSPTGAAAFRPHQRVTRALDILEGDDFIGMQRKRALDLMDGDGFGGFDKKKKKRALDMMEGDDFMGLKKRKRALNALEGDGFSALEKRALDILEGDDFIGMQRKRQSNNNNNGIQRALDRMNWRQQQLMQRTRRALDALEGNSFGF